jgi:hypothetical protein
MGFARPEACGQKCMTSLLEGSISSCLPNLQERLRLLFVCLKSQLGAQLIFSPSDL